MTSAIETRPEATVPTRALRILAVTNLWPEGGNYRGIFVQRQVTALRDLGHHVDVEVIAQSRGKLDYFAAAPRIRRRVQEGNYDILHIHYGLAAPASRFSGHQRRVLSLYGSDINVPRQRFVTKMGWGRTKARIYVSRRLAEKAGDDTGYVIANGVDFALFKPGDRLSARREAGIGPAEKVILFGGDPARPVKGYDLFREVLAELRRKGDTVRELILSAPGQPAADLVRKYDIADVMLFTSRPGSEGSPTVVKEATAMGLPVVSVDVGDVADVLDGVRPSAVVPYPLKLDSTARSRMVTELADRVREVLAYGKRADGREKSAWLDERQVAERIVAVYQKVLAG